MGTLGIESAIVMTMQQSLTKMKTIAACEQAVQCLREVTCEWQAKQATVTRSGIDDESSSFPLPLMAFAARSRVRLPLEMEGLFSVHNISW